MASPPNDDGRADKIFQLYLHDYMIKKGMHSAAEIFKKEAQVPENPIGMKFLDSTDDSPNGLLHEWWSIFYEVFSSRQGKDQETGSGSSSKVPMMMLDNAGNNALLRIPGILMNAQKTPQFQVNPCINDMMTQQIVGIMPSTMYNQENLGYQPKNVEPSFQIQAKNKSKSLSRANSKNLPQDVGKHTKKQVSKGIQIGMGAERDTHSAPLDVMQNTMLPLEGFCETKTNEALNLAPIDEWLMKPKCQMLKTQNQDVVFDQAIALIPKDQTIIVHENSSKCNTMKVCEIESSDKDKQMINQVITTVEHQNQQDQKMQLYSQNVNMRRRRKATISKRLGETAKNHESPTDDKTTYVNVESYLYFENDHVDHKVVPFSNLKRISTTCKNENKGFSFEEVGCLHSSKDKVLSSHFSSDGKVLASVGHEKKVFIWNMETFDCVNTTKTHSHIITDIRFRTNSTIFATSSFDRSVRLWDATKPTISPAILTGHTEQVMSLDFHPRKIDLLCSCDNNDVIRLWDINQRVCTHTTKGGSKQVRFQPCFGKLLATATGKNIKIYDVETNSLLYNLEGHVKDVLSICWDKSGNSIASVSEDTTRVWSLDGKCINELHSNGNRFQSCIFHPGYLNLLIVGSYQTLELWSPGESNKTLVVPAHKGLIVGLADSPEGELVASASHDHCVKLWK